MGNPARQNRPLGVGSGVAGAPADVEGTDRAVMHAVRLALGRLCGLGCRRGLLRQHQRAQLGVGGQHAVLAKRRSVHFAQRRDADTKTDQVQARPGHQCGQSVHELQRRHHMVRGAVAPGCLQLEHHLPAALVCTRSLASAGRVM